MQVQNLFAQVMEYTLRHATRYFWISSVHDLWFGETVQVRAFGLQQHRVEVRMSQQKLHALPGLYLALFDMMLCDLLRIHS